MVMPRTGDNNERRTTSACRGYVHVVKSGDTLYKLARQYDVKLFDIMRLNPYVNVYNLQMGDEICIPTTPARPERTYVVNAGDTIQRVLQALDVEFEDLARWNPMIWDVELPEGLILTMPMERPMNQPMSQQMNRPMNQQMTQPMNQQMTQPMNQQMTQPMNQPTTQPMNRSMNLMDDFDDDFDNDFDDVD